jgi:arabinogalactan oligomer/maltooligosaccharide transport system substrate-binding protein
MRRLRLLLCLILLLAGCRAAPSADGRVRGEILVWHGGNEAEAQVLTGLLQRFMEVYPNVRVVQSVIPADKLQEQFATRAEMGLGPDLLILPGQWQNELVEAGLVQDLTRYGLDLSAYLPTAVQALRYGDGLYGLPFSLQTTALYYNKELVAEPATTLDQLLAHANEGKQAVLYTDFYRAFWGIQAFGGTALDDQGRVVLDAGGFANWLGWLKIAQNTPGIILTNDQHVGLTLFTQGQAAYYVGGSDEAPALKEALGADKLGVTSLPAGPHGPAGPALRVDALMINAASSPAQTELALRLARFLTNSEQQTRLARELGRIPANTRVRIDRRINPLVAEFIAQARTGVALPNLPQTTDLMTVGDEAYAQALEGVLSVSEAAVQLSNQVNAKYGLTQEVEASAEQTCALEGTIRLWHRWPQAEAVALRQAVYGFMRRCPGVYVQLVQVESGTLYDRYREAVAQGQGPDLIIGPNEWVTPLAAEGLLRDVTQMATPDLLQRYLPNAPRTMMVGERLYGLPLSLRVMALYYNRSLMSDPPAMLTDLVNQATPERQVALPVGFYPAFWGLGAFGGLKTDANQQTTLEQEGVAAWLGWLRKAADHPGVVVSNDALSLQKQFAAGKLACFVGDSTLLQSLWNQTGSNAPEPGQIGVVPLPAGPADEARPLLATEGLMISASANDKRAALAFELAKYLTSVESQTLLMEQAGMVPANVSVNLDDQPDIAAFVAQGRVGVVLDNSTYSASLLNRGDALYARALSNNEDIEQLAALLVETINGRPANPSGGQALGEQ